jgi:hypothetical protein
MNVGAARPSTAPAGTWVSGSGLDNLPLDSSIESWPELNISSVRKRSRSFAKSLSQTKALYLRTTKPELTLQSLADEQDQIQANPKPSRRFLTAHDRFLVTRNVQTRLGTTGEGPKSPFKSLQAFSAMPSHQKNGAFFPTESKGIVIKKYKKLSKTWERHHTDHIKRFNRKWEEKMKPNQESGVFDDDSVMESMDDSHEGSDVMEGDDMEMDSAMMASLARRKVREIRRGHRDYVTGGYTQNGYIANRIRNAREQVARQIEHPSSGGRASGNRIENRLDRFLRKSRANYLHKDKGHLKVNIPHVNQGYRMRFLMGATSHKKSKDRFLPFYPARAYRHESKTEVFGIR